MMETYKPGHARIGQATPQTDPDLFTVAELKAEMKYLLRLAKKRPHPLYTIAINKLIAEIATR